MKKKKLFAVLNIVAFFLLAFSVSFEFANHQLELTLLLIGLIGTLVSAAFSVFNQKVWNASHGPREAQYEGAFKLLVSVIFMLIIIKAILSIAHLIPNSLDIFNFFTWIVGYTAMVSPNLIHIFKDHAKSKSTV
ncbi:hypothetical protein [Ekhidna sp.]